MVKLSYEMMKSNQSFQSVNELDQSVRGFLYLYKGQLSEGTMNVLKFIWRHSTEVPGVLFIKYHAIAESVGVSRRTVIRAVNKLEQLGFLSKTHTARQSGIQAANVFIIQPHPSISEVKNKVPYQMTLF
ncbi:helix-turn-helix domain-containing protein [Sutcliffiella cohnii]|uniref:helix-turn-helix domain-containing protein n=1 Tax=Sutcliffiella cohnii TaxID=33932 RepID=UPI002E1F5FE5|nr:helix-turn-helix domain-containing protein [Sutcliffiella cohnii]